ncbi:MAG: hypothetical protein ACUVT4_06775 [Actinomycetota bacterium]
MAIYGKGDWPKKDWERWRTRQLSTAGAGDSKKAIRTAEGVELSHLGRFLQAMLLNLVKDPEKKKALERMKLVVSLEPSRHPEQSFTLVFERGGVTLENGASLRADIRISGEVAMLILLSRVPFGLDMLKCIRTYEGRSLVAAIIYRDLWIKGAMRHLLQMS